jgi:phage terminase large subunit
MPAEARRIEIRLPYDWRPREYQQPFWRAMEGGCKRAVLVWHRRSGKDNAGFNWMITASQERVGLYWHLLPSYEQGRKVVWDGKTNGGRPFVSYIPEALIRRKRDDQMKVWLRNGSIIQIVGADEPNRLVGSNPVGVNLSEFSVSPNYETCWRLLSPILAANNGWAIWLYTARGRNHGWRMYRRALEMAKTNPRWFVQLLTVDDTRDEDGNPVITQEMLDEERASGMSEELIQQEYYNNFDTALVGSYYGKYIADARKEGRIGLVPWEPSIPVDTGWDLGSSNATCIWFKQQVGAQRRIIDFYMRSGEDLAHYVKMLQGKPYIYGKHYLPHDVEVKELNAKHSRKEILRSLGVRATLVPRIERVDDGIEIVRNYLRTCWFDEKNCDRAETDDDPAMPGLQGLLEYVRKETREQGPGGEPFYSEEPVHNWASDVADSFRTLACGDRTGKYARTPDPDRRKQPSPFGRRVAIV